MSEESKAHGVETLESQCRDDESNLLILLSIIDSFGVLDLRGLDTSRLRAQYDEVDAKSRHSERTK